MSVAFEKIENKYNEKLKKFGNFKEDLQRTLDQFKSILDEKYVDIWSGPKRRFNQFPITIPANTVIDTFRKHGYEKLIVYLPNDKFTIIKLLGSSSEDDFEIDEIECERPSVSGVSYWSKGIDTIHFDWRFEELIRKLSGKIFHKNLVWGYFAMKSHYQDLVKELKTLSSWMEKMQCTKKLERMFEGDD